MTENQLLEVEEKGHIAWLILNHPEKRSSFQIWGSEGSDEGLSGKKRAWISWIFHDLGKPEL